MTNTEQTTNRFYTDTIAGGPGLTIVVVRDHEKEPTPGNRKPGTVWERPVRYGADEHPGRGDAAAKIAQATAAAERYIAEQG